MDPGEDDNLKPEEALGITKKMFIGGFVFLPWLWLCNAIFYREYLYGKPHIPEKVKFYVRGSLLGFALYSIAFLVWLIIYLASRNAWGVSGDKISLVIPNGQ